MARHCLFCGHLVHGELLEQCERCGAYRQALDEKRVRSRCPRCHDVRLVPFALGPVALQACERCKGSFLAATEWDALFDVFVREPLPDVVIGEPAPAASEGAERSPYRTAPLPEDAAERTTDLAAEVQCPTCERPMDRLEFGGISGIVIDVCNLHGVWLDAGELERIVDATKELERAERRARGEPQLTVPRGADLDEHVRAADDAAIARILELTSREEKPAEEEEEPRVPDRVARGLEPTSHVVLRPLARLLRWLRARVAR